MTVDRRLQQYFTDVRNFNRTKQSVWVDILEIMAKTDYGPAGRAAKKFLNNVDKRKENIESG